MLISLQPLGSAGRSNNHDNSNKSQATSRYRQIPHGAQGPHCVCERVPRWEHASGMRQSPRLTAPECHRPSHGEGRTGNAALLYFPGQGGPGAATLTGLFAPPGPGRAPPGGKAPSPTLTAVTGQAGPSTAPAAASRCRPSLHNGISVLVPNSPARARKQVHKQVLLISLSREALAPTGMPPPAAVITLPKDTHCEYRSRAGESTNSPDQPHSRHSGQHSSLLVYFVFALQDLDTGPYLHTKVPLARPTVESWSITLNPGASTACALSPASLQLEPDGLSSLW